METELFSQQIFMVKGGDGGDAHLIIGDRKTALVDCGMAYCASNLIQNVKNILATRPLDYVLISHSHYDHIGAIPYLRLEWPNLKICGSERDQKILNRPNALKMIRELSHQAAQIYSDGFVEDYNDNLMKIDTVIAEGNQLDLGNIGIQVLETPGHTQSSLSFFINDEILFVSESCGVYSHVGKIYPSFLVSYFQTIESIKKCQAICPKFIFSSHYGLVGRNAMINYWRESLEAADKSRYFILHYSDLGYSEDKILFEYEKFFYDEGISSEQPINAFRLNARHMIKSVLK